MVVEFDDICKEFEESVGEREEVMQRELRETTVSTCTVLIVERWIYA